MNTKLLFIPKLLVISTLVFGFAVGGAAGCSGGDGSAGNVDGGGTPDLVPAVMPGADATVTAFDKTPIYFTGMDNKRTVDLPASFPTAGAYKSITLHLQLDCPKVGGCDVFDRLGTLGIVTQKGQNGGGDTVIELLRFITPFRVGASWDLDVTDLRPLLTGDVTLRAFIDTWVGPGSQYGGGWLLTARFDMKGGIPAKQAVSVVPVWTQRSVVYGDAAKPIAMSAPPAAVQLPTASSYALRAFITGHGQGNADNCAEFCERMHTITVGKTPHPLDVWRDDCATTAAPHQQGTFQYARSGWCPGADVKPWILDITADVAGSTTAMVAYDIDPYDNTCRPDAKPCAACSLGTSCMYDGGNHTEPFFSISTLLIGYR